MTFTLDEEQVKKCREWCDTHECSCRKPGFGRYAGFIGGADTFKFTPTSIGVVVWVKCACGAELDLTGDL